MQIVQVAALVLLNHNTTYDREGKALASTVAASAVGGITRMFSDNVAARVLGLVIVGGVLSTGLSFCFSSLSRKAKGGDNNVGSYSDQTILVNGGHDGINGGDVGKIVNDIPPDFRVVIHGGAGVVSEGIDSKPFFNALTRIMADAYKFAKDGESNGVTGKNDLSIF